MAGPSRQSEISNLVNMAKEMNPRSRPKMDKDQEENGNESDDYHKSAFRKYDEDTEVFEATTNKLSSTPPTVVISPTISTRQCRLEWESNHLRIKKRIEVLERQQNSRRSTHSSSSDDSVQLLGIIPFPEPEVMCIDNEVCLDDIFPQEMVRDVLSSSHDSSIQIIADFGPIIDLVSNDSDIQEIESRISAESEAIQDIKCGALVQNVVTPPAQRYSRSRGF